MKLNAGRSGPRAVPAAPSGTLAPPDEAANDPIARETALRLVPRAPAPALRSLRAIPSLDGIRAVSFMLVFIAHAGLQNVVPGGLGVTIFFFLSGYLITTLMRVEFERHGTVSLRRFWARRALRILPAFYLVLLMGTLLGSALGDSAGLQRPAIAAQVLHLSNYWYIYHGFDGVAAGTGVYWSLAVEEHFYLLFPLLYLTMQKWQVPRFRQALLMWGLCVAALAWRCALVLGLHAVTDRTYLATDTRVDSILFGCALAVWNNPALDATEQREPVWKYLVVPAALGALLACVLYRGPAFRETWRYTIQGVALTFLFIAAVRYCNWPLFRILNWRPMVGIGLLSYSLYLLHQVALSTVDTLRPDLPEALRAAMALAGSLLVAWIIYRLVEKPCARLRARLST